MLWKVIPACQMWRLDRMLGQDAVEQMDENKTRIGPFSSWKSLYLTVIAYTAILALLLYVMTVFLDTSAQ